LSADEKREDSRLSGKDVVAIVIAALQTTLLPFLIVIIVLLVLTYVIAHLYS
jgi:hypothetical protein